MWLTGDEHHKLTHAKGVAVILEKLPNYSVACVESEKFSFKIFTYLYEDDSSAKADKPPPARPLHIGEQLIFIETLVP